jgi:hypothetical protein
MGVCHHCTCAMADRTSGKFTRGEHGAFNVNMTVNQGRQNEAPFLHFRIFPDRCNDSVINLNVARENTPGNRVNDHAGYVHPHGLRQSLWVLSIPL